MGKSHFVSQYRIYVHRTEEPTMSSDKNLIIESTAEENQIEKISEKSWVEKSRKDFSLQKFH